MLAEIKRGVASFLSIINPGLWALFFLALAVSLLFLVIRIDRLPMMLLYYCADGFDTFLSIKITKDIGIWGVIPYFDMPVSLFGYAPVLFGLLGAGLDYLLRDAALSMFVLYALTDACIFLLLYFRFFRKQPLHMKLLLCSFFVFNMMFENLFPFGQRMRQQLAILLGLLLFLQENPIATFALSLLAMLAQPFTGFLMSLSYVIHVVEKTSIPSFLKRNAGTIIPVLLAVLAAIPFYQGLVSGFFGAPHYYSCNNLSTLLLPSIFYWPFCLFCLLFMYDNRRLLGASEAFAILLIFFVPAAFVFLDITKDFLPFPVFDFVLRLMSITCPYVFLNVGAFLLLASLGYKKYKLGQLPITLLLLISLLNLSVSSIYLAYELPLQRVALYQDGVSFLEANDIHNVKTLEADAFDQGGKIFLAPRNPRFSLQGYSIMKGANLHFVDEMNLPPEMSRGRTNILTVGLLTAILQKNESCSEMTGALRDADVDAIAYEITPSVLISPERHSQVIAAFKDTDFLDRCSLELIEQEEPGLLTNQYQIVYKIKNGN